MRLRTEERAIGEVANEGDEAMADSRDGVAEGVRARHSVRVADSDVHVTDVNREHEPAALAACKAKRMWANDKGNAPCCGGGSRGKHTSSNDTTRP